MKKKQGLCPYCNSGDIDYLNGDFTDGELYDYNCKCNKCGKEFIEGYHLVFDGIYDKDGNEIK